jgi:hypothetical protein
MINVRKGPKRANSQLLLSQTDENTSIHSFSGKFSGGVSTRASTAGIFFSCLEATRERNGRNVPTWLEVAKIRYYDAEVRRESVGPPIAD